MARQFIYHMSGLSKTFSGGKKVLDNINLSFYPDAKIGVLGPNGAGKSTLLKIMAGLDKEFVGEAWAAEGAIAGTSSERTETRCLTDGGKTLNITMTRAGNPAIEEAIWFVYEKTE